MAKTEFETIDRNLRDIIQGEGQLVIIAWHDAQLLGSNWTNRSSITVENIKPMVNKSVGFVMYNSDNYITILETACLDENANQGMMRTIPKGCILYHHDLVVRVKESELEDVK